MKKQGWKQAQNSYIVRFFIFLTQFVYHAISVGLLGRIFTAYTATDQRFRTSFVGHLVHARERRSGKLYRTFRRNIALAMDQSLIARGMLSLLRKLCRCSLRTLGLFLVTAGSYSALMYWLFSVIWNSNAVGVLNLYCGIIMLILGFLLLFSDVSLGYALQNGLFFTKVLVGVFGMADDALHDVEKTGTQGYVIAVPLGMVLGALGALVSPFYLIMAAALLLFFLLVLSVPEAGVMVLILLLPFMGLLPNGERWLLLILGLPMISYLIKLLRGNRAVHVEVQDVPAMLMTLLFVLSGVSVAGQGAWRGALLSALCVAFCFMVVNVITTPRWLDRCRVGMIVSATVSALLGIFQFVFTAVEVADFSFSTVGAAVRAGFADRTTFAYALVTVLPLILSAFASVKKKYRLPVGFALVSVTVAIALTWVQSAWIAAVVILAVFLLLYKRYAFPFVLVGGALTPVTLVMLPSGVRKGFLDFLRADSGAALALNTNAAGIAGRIFFERGNGIFGAGAGISRLLFGLGYGGIEQFCMLYTVTDPTVLSGSMNFWLYRLLEGGILGVLLPAAFLFLLCQNCFSLLRVTKNREAKLSAIAGVAMVAGVLILSLFRYAWYDPAALLSFFLVAAMIAAAARHERAAAMTVEHDEEKHEDRAFEVEYYG